MNNLSTILGFIIYCGICYVIDWLEYNYCKIMLILTGNYEEN